jgi:hypothetical protein
MKTLTSPGFSQTILNVSRTDSYPVPHPEMNPQANDRPLVLIQEESPTQNLRSIQQAISQSHRDMLKQYSLERRLFW